MNNKRERLKEKYPDGSRVRWIYSQRPLEIKEGDVIRTMLDSEDRILVKFCYGADSRGNPIMCEASVHESRILPARI